MTLLTVQGLLVPLLGTSLGAACVLFMKKYFSIAVQNGLMGFAAGVMVAASVWSLLIPSIEQSQHLGKLAFFPAVAGFCIGIVSLLLTDKVIDKLQKSTQNEENYYAGYCRCASQHSRGDGGRRCLCKCACNLRKRRIFRRICISYGNCNTKSARRCDNFHAVSGKGYEQGQGIL